MEQGIVALFTADARFSALASDRLYPVVLPESLLGDTSTTPTSATYQVISSIEEQTNDGPTGIFTSRIQFDAWAVSYGDAKALAKAICVILDGYTGTLTDGTTVANTWLDSAGPDGYDEDSRLFRCVADYKLIYTE